MIHGAFTSKNIIMDASPSWDGGAAAREMHMY
jgi:hypothetical protein